jgi:hypothetical protein
MDAAIEKLQWQICLYCGSQTAPDPRVIDNLVTQGMDRGQAEAFAIKHVYLACPNRPEHKLEGAHPKGFRMVPPEELQHGGYYHGNCRNARVARWNAETKKFVYIREKFRAVFAEEIDYWIDAQPGEHRFDEFRPYGKLENPPFEIPLVLPPSGPREYQ